MRPFFFLGAPGAKEAFERSADQIVAWSLVLDRTVASDFSQNA